MPAVFPVALALGILLLTPRSLAADSVKYHVEVWRTDRGLPQSSVTSVAQTSDGYLWVGTQNGLARFDGITFKVFDENNTPAIKNSRIAKLFEDHEKSLWIGTEQGGVVRYRGGGFTPFELPSKGGTTHNYAWAFAEDAQRGLWLLNCEWNLNRFDQNRFVSIPLGSEYPGKSARAMTADVAGRILVGTEMELIARTNEMFRPLATPSAQTNETLLPVEFLAPSRSGGYWVAWNGRLRKMESAQWVADLGDYAWTNHRIYDLYEDRKNRLWVATMGSGLFRYGPDGAVLHLTTKDGLPTDFIRCVTEDREGNIWVGTEGGGLCRLKPALFQTYGLAQGLASDQVMSVCERGPRLWVGLNGDGLDKLENGAVEHFGLEQGLHNGHAWSVLEDRRGTTWVGTWDGLFKGDGKKFSNLSDGSTLGWQVLALYEDSRGDLWVGQQAFGALTRLRGDERDVVKIPGTSASLDVRAFVEDREGNIWVGTNGEGLYCRRNGQWTRFGKKEGLGSEFIWSLYCDADGALWVGTCRGGLSRWREGRFTTWMTKDGLVNNVICQILEDKAGNLWLGSYGGVFHVSKSQLNDPQNKTIQCVSYGQHDGLPSIECQGGFQPSGCKSQDGRLWFPTIKGLAVVDPDDVVQNPLGPPVIIEELLVGGERTELIHATVQGATTNQAEAAELIIPPGEQSLEFHFTALSLRSPEAVRFKYQLTDLEKNWVDAGSRRTVHYSSVPPGHYRFRVIACNNDGVWNEQGATLALVVLPYFWQTKWFLIATALVGLATVAGIASNVVARRLQRRLELAERDRAVERERTRIAQDMHDDLGSHLTEIALLSEFAHNPESPPEAVREDVGKIMTKARALTASLDEIVWAVDPENDSLESFVTYACSFAENYLQTARISCRLELPDQFPPAVLTTDARHNLFLAFKEGLNNVVKHAHATEVRISITCLPGTFTVNIRDNGRGFVVPINRSPKAAGVGNAGQTGGPSNGLVNMHKRMASIQGHCELLSRLNAGTEVKLTIPFHTK